MLEKELGINLIESSDFEAGESKPEAGIESLIPDEIKNETEYKILGNVVVLPTPLEKSHHQKDENFPNGTNLKNRKVMFLVAGLNENTKEFNRALLVFEELGTTFGEFGENEIVFTNREPLKAWTDLLQTNDQKEKDCCLYKSNNGYPTLAFDKWIIGARKNYKISNVGISNPKPMYLEEIIPPEMEKRILEMNQKNDKKVA
jgi:hypothetical protein